MDNSSKLDTPPHPPPVPCPMPSHPIQHAPSHGIGRQQPTPEQQNLQIGSKLQQPPGNLQFQNDQLVPSQSNQRSFLQRVSRQQLLRRQQRSRVHSTSSDQSNNLQQLPQLQQYNIQQQQQQQQQQHQQHQHQKQQLRRQQRSRVHSTSSDQSNNLQQLPQLQQHSLHNQQQQQQQHQHQKQHCQQQQHNSNVQVQPQAVHSSVSQQSSNQQHQNVAILHQPVTSTEQIHTQQQPPVANDPWAEPGWKRKSLQIRVYDILDKVWTILNLKYIEEIFSTSGIEAVRCEGTPTVGSMKFFTQEDAAATLERFGGGFFPGHVRRMMVMLQWLEPPLGETKRTISCKCKRSSPDPNVSKRQKRGDNFVPFTDFTSGFGREVVERFQFKAICIVSSVKPSDPRSSKTVCTPLGSRILYGLYKYADVEHVEGRTWGGDFELEDLLVSHTGCMIDKVPGKPFSSLNIILDENKILNLVSPSYMLNGELPPHFGNLRSEISQAPRNMHIDADKMLEHSAKMMSNPALSTTSELSHLVQGFSIAWDGTDVRDKSVITSMKEAQFFRDDWRPITNMDKLLLLIFRDSRFNHKTQQMEHMWPAYRPDLTASQGMRFSPSVVSQCLNNRHLLVHAAGRSKVQSQPIFEDIRELILFIYHYYPNFFPRFIKFLLGILKDYPLIRSECKSYFER